MAAGLSSLSMVRVILNSARKTLSPACQLSVSSRQFSEARDLQNPGANTKENTSETSSASVEPWMQREIDNYHQGLARLANAMGTSLQDMTPEQTKSALRYLLPSKLTAKDARPFLKHPDEIYPKRKESLFDGNRPLEPGFYSGSPRFANTLHAIHSYLEESRRGTAAAAAAAGSQEGVGSGEEGGTRSRKMRWKKKDEIENLIRESLSSSQHQHLVDTLKRTELELGGGHSPFLDQFRRPVDSFTPSASLEKTKEDSAWSAVGKRKTSSAHVTITQGSGVVTVNGSSFIRYFPRVADREQILYPLLLLDCLRNYNVTASVQGGGISGQTGAIRHGISKAMSSRSLDFNNILTKEGLLIRDPRTVERKKPGQKKARKKFSWVKR